MTNEKQAVRMTQQQYDEKVSEMARSNHMWINAFDCIRPTDELKKRIGEWVLSCLNENENLLPSSGITSTNKTIRELAELTPMLYLSVNKS